MWRVLWDVEINLKAINFFFADSQKDSSLAYASRLLKCEAKK